jgi:hypothetical protein
MLLTNSRYCKSHNVVQCYQMYTWIMLTVPHEIECPQGETSMPDSNYNPHNAVLLYP